MPSNATNQSTASTSVSFANNLVGFVLGIMTLVGVFLSILKWKSEPVTATGSTSTTIHNVTVCDHEQRQAAVSVESVNLVNEGTLIEQLDTNSQSAAPKTPLENQIVVEQENVADTSVSFVSDSLRIQTDISGYYIGTLTSPDLGSPWSINFIIKERDFEFRGEFFVQRNTIVQRRYFAGRKVGDEIVLTVLNPDRRSRQPYAPALNTTMRLSTKAGEKGLIGSWSAEDSHQGGKIDLHIKNKQRRT